VHQRESKTEKERVKLWFAFVNFLELAFKKSAKKRGELGGTTTNGDNSSIVEFHYIARRFAITGSMESRQS